jgi:outer membrane lipoprotein carrier protein
MMLRRLLGLTVCLLVAPVYAGGLDSLDAFIKSTRSGRASFVQTVTAPPKDGMASRPKVSTGTLEFVRPSRFRFVYKKPFEQTIVADGQTLWLYDVDLAQVTARKQGQVLGATPAALIASAVDVHALEEDFELSDAQPLDGLQWVYAAPRNKDSSLSNVRIGLKGSTLVSLDIVDSFGQRSVLKFSAFEANPALDPGIFQFKPPAGVDVLRQ